MKGLMQVEQKGQSSQWGTQGLGSGLTLPSKPWPGPFASHLYHLTTLYGNTGEPDNCEVPLAIIMREMGGK